MIDAYVDGRPMPRSSSALHEGRLGVARGRRGRVALGLELERLQLVARLQLRQRPLLVASGAASSSRPSS